jgi:flavin reductase (DIM6/NTAB) family NADH-FMN oxidoreductase RutF
MLMGSLTVLSGEELNSRVFWMTLGQRPIGMTVVTADSDSGPTGFLGLSAAHVTASPPTMLVSVDHSTNALGGILSRRHFAVNFLPATATNVANAFGGKSGISGPERFSDVDWCKLSTGAPVFRDALGVFDCLVDEVLQRGDVSIIFGKVVAVASGSLVEPLIFFRGRSYSGIGQAE